MSLYFPPAAESELTEAALYYADVRQGLGEAFITAVELAAELVLARPQLGVVVAEENVRRLPVRGFPYSLIYRVLPDRIRILAVAHHRRQPQHWLGRH